MMYEAMLFMVWMLALIGIGVFFGNTSENDEKWSRDNANFLEKLRKESKDAD